MGNAFKKSGNKVVREVEAESSGDDSISDEANDEDIDFEDVGSNGFEGEVVDYEVNTEIGSSTQNKYITAINTTLSNMGLKMEKFTWLSTRIEIIVNKAPGKPANKVEGTEKVEALGGLGVVEEEARPSASELEKAHRDIYTFLETSDATLVEKFEILVASPGIEDVLRSPRDFLSFQGFPVIVTTSELFKKKTQFEGTLQERNEEHVVISAKGRIVKIPVAIVSRVELPKPKFEPTDSEIRKLR